MLLVGLPACGKTTWLTSHGITDALSSDEIRRLLTGDPGNQQANRVVFAVLRNLLRRRLELQMAATYIDATNLTRRERSTYIAIAQLYGAEADAVFFDVPLEVCQERNRQRARVVPEDVLRRMAGRLVPPARSEGLRHIEIVRWVPML